MSVRVHIFVLLSCLIALPGVPHRNSLAGVFPPRKSTSNSVKIVPCSYWTIRPRNCTVPPGRSTTQIWQSSGAGRTTSASSKSTGYCLRNCDAAWGDEIGGDHNLVRVAASARRNHSVEPTSYWSSDWGHSGRPRRRPNHVLRGADRRRQDLCARGRNDGIQLWTWLLPENAHDVELVCGDWMGGALISANQPDYYTLCTVGKDGKLRWKHRFSGLRKGHAYNLQHLVHILSQSADGTITYWHERGFRGGHV